MSDFGIGERMVSDGVREQVLRHHGFDTEVGSPARGERQLADILGRVRRWGEEAQHRSLSKDERRMASELVEAAVTLLVRPGSTSAA